MSLVEGVVSTRTIVRALSHTRWLGRQHRLTIAIAAFLALLAAVAFFSSVPLGYYDVASMATSGATLALAAAGQTIVILSGGFDLSAGAVISLVNVALASQSLDPAARPLLIVAIGVGIGALTGAFNGFFVAILRMQPIVVTLSTMFIVQGITLLVMDKPGGAVPASLGEFLIGDAVPGVLPKPVLLIAVLILLWAWLKRTRFGVAIYALGSDRESARAAGVSTRFVEFIVYVIAGGC
jgi:ribose transport system permease protein